MGTRSPEQCYKKWIDGVIRCFLVLTACTCGFFPGESGTCFWSRQIILMVPQFLRAGSCLTPPQTRPGRLPCRLLTLTLSLSRRRSEAAGVEPAEDDRQSWTELQLDLFLLNAQKGQIFYSWICFQVCNNLQYVKQFSI